MHIRNYLAASWQAIVDRPLSFALGIPAFSLCMAFYALSMAYVQFEAQYDRWVPDHDRVFRVDRLVQGNMRKGAWFDASIDEIKKNSENVELIGGMRYVNYRVGHESRVVSLKALSIHGDFDAIIDVRYLYGGLQIAEPGQVSVALSKSRAVELFGEASGALGKILSVHESTDRRLSRPDDFRFFHQVVAVFDDWRSDSHLTADALLLVNARNPAKTNDSMQWPPSFWPYVKLRKDSRSASALEEFDLLSVRAEKASYKRFWEMSEAKAERFASFGQPVFSPIAEIHLNSTLSNGLKPLGNAKQVIATRMVAFAFLLIGSFNFAWLIAETFAKRLNEFVARKVFGTDIRLLVLLACLDVVIVVSAACLLATCIVHFANSAFQGYLGISFSFKEAMAGGLWFQLLVSLIVVFAVSISAPVAAICRIQPATIFRGVAANLLQFRPFVIGFVGFEVALVVVAVIGMSTMVQQVRYAGAIEFPAETDNTFLVISPLPGLDSKYSPGLQRRMTSFSGAVRQLPGVLDIAFADQAPVMRSPFNSKAGQYVAGNEGRISVVTIGRNYFDVLGVKLLVGRRFGESDYVDSIRHAAVQNPSAAAPRKVLINRQMAEKLSFEVPERAVGEVFFWGQRVSTVKPSEDALPFEIIGVVPNLFHDWQFGERSRPAIYMAGISGIVRGVVVRHSGIDRQLFVQQLTDLYKDHFPGQIQISPNRSLPGAWVDTELEDRLQPERKRMRMLFALTAVVVFVALLGIHSAAQSVIRAQRREMAIRKIFGSSTRSTISRVLWVFTPPVVIANAIAWPLTYLLMEVWLSTFSKRITQGSLTFIWVGVVLSMIFMAVIAYEASRFSSRAPIRDL